MTWPPHFVKKREHCSSVSCSTNGRILFLHKNGKRCTSQAGNTIVEANLAIYNDDNIDS